MRNQLFFVLVFLFFACEGETEKTTVKPVSKALVVVNSLAKTLSLVNLETNEIQNNAAGVGNAPNQVVLKDSLVLVVNSLSNDLSVFYFNKNDSLVSLGTFDLGISQNRNPWFLEVTNDSTAFVTNWLKNSVTKISLKNFTVTKEIFVGSFPQGILKVQNKLLVTNTNYPKRGSVSVIDLQTETVEKTVSVGYNPQDLASDGSGKIHVVCTGNYDTVFGKIFILDENFVLSDSLEIGGNPADIKISREGIAYLSAGGFAEKGAKFGSVFSYDTKTLEILHGTENPIITDFGASRLVFDKQERLYVSCFDADAVNVLENDSVLIKFSLGDGTQGIAVKN